MYEFSHKVCLLHCVLSIVFKYLPSKLNKTIAETFVLQNLDNQSSVNEWIQKKVSFMQDNFLDGINLYVDDPVDKGSELAGKLTQFVKLVTETFHNKIKGSIVVFNVPFSPYNEKSK